MGNTRADVRTQAYAMIDGKLAAGTITREEALQMANAYGLDLGRYGANTFDDQGGKSKVTKRAEAAAVTNAMVPADAPSKASLRADAAGIDRFGYDGTTAAQAPAAGYALQGGAKAPAHNSSDDQGNTWYDPTVYTVDPTIAAANAKIAEANAARKSPANQRIEDIAVAEWNAGDRTGLDPRTPEGARALAEKNAASYAGGTKSFADSWDESLYSDPHAGQSQRADGTWGDIGPGGWFNEFLETNPAGQAIAPLLGAGVGVSTGAGFHMGMADPGRPNNSPLPNTGDPDIYNPDSATAGFRSGTQDATPAYAPDGTVISGTLDPNQGPYPTPSGNPITSGSQVGNVAPPGSTAQVYGSDPSTGSPPPGTPGTSSLPGNQSLGTSFVDAPGTSVPNKGGIDGTGLLLGANALAGAAGSIYTGNAMADAQIQAAKEQAQTAENVRLLQEKMWNEQRADLAPWRDAGTKALGQLGTFEQDNPAFSFNNDPNDPNQDKGYAFRLSEGIKALDNSAASRGMLQSGNTMKAAINYGQEAGSQEYNNAYNRYNTTRGAKLNALQSLAGVGQSAVQQTNQAGQNYATNAGNAMMAGGNARAGGMTGATDARSSGYMGAMNTVNNNLGQWLNYNNSNNMTNAMMSMMRGA